MTERNESKTPLDTSSVPQRRAPMPNEDALALIDAANYAVLSTVDEAGNPYGVPVSAARDKAAEKPVLYFHSTAFEGSRKALNMSAVDRVCLCFVGRAVTVGERYTVDYESVVAAGRVERVTAKDELAHGFDVLLKRFSSMCGEEANRRYLEAHASYMPALWRVAVDRLTGKRHPAA